MIIFSAIICVLMVGVMGLLVWVIIGLGTGREQAAAQKISLEMMGQQLSELKEAENKLRESTERTLVSSNQNITKTLETNQKLISSISGELGKIQQSNEHLMQMGSDLKRLQDILQSPKLRGQLGEWSLENLLTQILPLGTFSLQSKMADGQIADAIVHLDKYCVVIDAKFPLSNFENMINEENETQKERLRKAFVNDVKKHIDKIAKDYIKPADGTLDFAIMYIPAENVYYEAVVNSSDDEKGVLAYSMEKKVVAVSPNLLYAYLMTVVMGLHGLEIEKQAAHIRKNIGKLGGLFGDFSAEWTKLGGHIKNSFNKYDEAAGKLNKIDAQISQMQNNEDES